jgi:phosphatidylinositol phospholipase C delta
LFTCFVTFNFIRSKEVAETQKMPVAEEKLSLSILFRVSSVASDRLVQEENLEVTKNTANTIATLDLIIPSHNDLELFIITLRNLMILNRKYILSMQQDIILMQHHWMEIGKSLDTNISCAEWSTICSDKLSSGIGRNSIVSLFRKYCNAMNTNPEDGLSLQRAVGLLSQTQKLRLRMSLCDDPREKIWNLVGSIMKGAKPLDKKNMLPKKMVDDPFVFPEANLVGSSSSELIHRAILRSSSKLQDKETEGYISAKDFLRFLQSEQHEYDKTLSDVRDLFQRLNTQTSAFQLDRDGISNRASVKEADKDYITKTVFLNYLRSDINDLFNPVKGEIEHDDMDQPLSSYWINASHDTYLKGTARVNPKMLTSDSSADISMYTYALYRGCRCLEIDVWDGLNEQKCQPVVRYHELKNIGKVNIRKSEILFSDVIVVIHSFLQSVPASLPIILIIETNCSKENQDIMADILETILGADDMLFIPDNHEDDSLPSPNALRGKVVIKAKLPKQGQTKVICDDFDELNDIDPFDVKQDYSENVVPVIPGVDDVSHILFDSSTDLEKDPDDIVRKAKAEAVTSKQQADAAEDRAFNINIALNRTTEIADKLMKEAGLSTEHGKEQQERSRSEVDCTKKKYGESGNKGLIENDGSVSCDSHDMETVGGNTMSTRDSTVVTEKSKKGFFDWLMRFIDDYETDDNDDYTRGSSLNYKESRQEGETVNDSFDSTELESRDSDSYDKDEFDIDVDIDVKDFSNSGGTLVNELKGVMEEERGVQTRSLSNVRRKLQDENEQLDGVEVQHFYSSTVDYALTEQRAAQEAVERASKVLDTASASLRKQQEEYEKVKLVEKFYSIQDKLEESNLFKKQAETSSQTARTEYKISAERAAETTEASKNARTQREKAHTEVQELLETLVGYEQDVLRKKVAFEESKRVYDACNQKLQVVQYEYEKVSSNISKIEGSHRFKVEKREESKGVLRDGATLKNHRMELEKQRTLTKKLQDLQVKKSDAGIKMKSASRSLEEAEEQLKEQQSSILRAEKYADECDAYVEQMDQLEEEENDAAKMREEASYKAASIVQKCHERIKQLTTELEVTKKSIPNNFDLGDRAGMMQICDEIKNSLRSAQSNFEEAQQSSRWANARLVEANNVLTENADILYEAKKNAVQREHRVNADQTLKENALKAYKSMQVLEKEAKDAKARASELRSIAAEKAAAYRRAIDYKHRRSMVREVSPSLARLTLLTSSKFRYFEESLVQPVNEMLSLSEGRILQIVAGGDEDQSRQLNEFSKTHLTRVYPSRHKKLRKQSQNFNPVLPWSLGCQVVAMNQQSSDAFILVNDGRFRTNGSCGYVLKPHHLIQPQGRLFNRPAPQTTSSRWHFKILSGYNLPPIRKKTASSGPLNPRVRVTLYDGGGEDPVVHVTKPVKNNGLNPVWDESDGITFDSIKYPDVAIVMFSVWDFESEGSENFVAAAAIPLSCMRQGYRSVPLFDVEHMRCGAHAFTSLFVHAKAQ